LSDATYLYAIVKASRRPSLAGAPPGVPDATPVALHAVSPSLWLLTAGVPLKVYGPGTLETSLADMDWVGRAAVAHEQVVEHFARRRGATLIPMKLFTMFSTPERAVAEIAPRRRSIERVMQRVAGAEEWGLRIIRTDAGRSPAVPAPSPASGAAFLAARKRARDAHHVAQQAAAAAAAEAFRALAGIAKDAVRRQERLPAGVTPPLLDAALLVAVRDRRKFDAAARRHALACAKASAQLTLTGPWPPYNFVRMEP
jgi:hypothetical protein